MMRDDNIQLPSEFPAIEIEASDELKARKILLGLAVQYGKMTDESLSSFAIESGINMDWISSNIELGDLSIDLEPNMDQDDTKESIQKEPKACPSCGAPL